MNAHVRHVDDHEGDERHGQDPVQRHPEPFQALAEDIGQRQKDRGD